MAGDRAQPADDEAPEGAPGAIGGYPKYKRAITRRRAKGFVARQITGTPPVHREFARKQARMRAR